jgi:monoamine oxidase
MTTHYSIETLGINKPPAKVDVALIGAGMSSLYTAWRLRREKPELKICILERSNRTGGRLDSDLVEFENGCVVKEEQGGMRFTFDTMDDLMSLFMMLDLDDQIVPFPMNSDGNNRLYFRGHAFTNKDSSKDNYGIWSELYDLNPAERGINPKTIIDTAFNRILAANPKFTDRPVHRDPVFWQRFRLNCQWNGQPLIDWSLWNLLTDMGYSNECITMLYRLLGFNGTFLSRMNAGEAYQLLEDFPADPQFRTLKEGFSTLPNALVSQIGGDTIFLNTNVDAISNLGEGYDLTCTQTSESNDTTTCNVEAAQVIVCVPRLAMEKLFVRSDAFNNLPTEQSNALWNTLQTTTNQPLLKINLYYDHAWWGNDLTGQPPVSFGPNFSDLPLGSVYPFYSINEELLADLDYKEWLKQDGHIAPEEIAEKLRRIDGEKFNRPAAMTIYCDYLNINYWRALQHNGPKFNSPLQAKYDGKSPQTIFPASEAVVKEATRLFGLLFNTSYVPEPKMTSARIWAGTTVQGVPRSEQVGYGVHQWGLHAKDKEVIAALVNPLPNLFTCGEAFSDFQGWVEGALRSADLVLKRAFDLDPISVVFETEHCQSSSDAVKAAYEARATERIRTKLDPDFPGFADGTMPDGQYDVRLTYHDRAKPDSQKRANAVFESQ